MPEKWHALPQKWEAMPQKWEGIPLRDRLFQIRQAGTAVWADMPAKERGQTPARKARRVETLPSGPIYNI